MKLIQIEDEDVDILVRAVSTFYDENYDYGFTSGVYKKEKERVMKLLDYLRKKLDEVQLR